MVRFGNTQHQIPNGSHFKKSVAHLKVLVRKTRSFVQNGQNIISDASLAERVPSQVWRNSPRNSILILSTPKITGASRVELTTRINSDAELCFIAEANDPSRTLVGGPFRLLYPSPPPI
ncbi:hypothetical protein CDAR_235371 [Caerostris darwini]|uniref:Uncharacterized protein n=1 Tax=Caerostris darwini TaxID=1538125 RepID=A0AAV4VQE9_9ARAC|nr:hypothetical protein CDAR_235371 [Caerostris darwini]